MASEGDAFDAFGERAASTGADDDGLTVESLEEVADARRRTPLHRAGAAALRALLGGRRRSRRARLARGALTVAVVAVTLFALLDGPALTLAGWQRLTFALRSGALAPRLAMTSWQSVPPPSSISSATLTYTADPRTPARVYACQASATGVLVWRTDTLGRLWLRQQASPTPPQSCQVKVALDLTDVALLVARAPDPLRPGCQRMSLAISLAAGDDWLPVSLPATATSAPTCQSDAWASAHWVFAWWTHDAVPEPGSTLMRSADLGQTWQPADGGLPARGAYLAPALTSAGAGGALLAQLYYWPRRGRLNILRQVVRSLDSGSTWDTLSSRQPVAVLAASLEPRIADVGAWSALYATTYTDGDLAPPWIPDQPPEAIQTLNTRTGVWGDLPPLPVNGAAARDHLLGVAMTLGVAPATTLLTLGADPYQSVTGRVDARDLWLWAWDPLAREWRLGLSAPPLARLVGFTWGAGPVGSAYEQVYGAYLWLTSASGGRQTLDRAFIAVPTGS